MAFDSLSDKLSNVFKRLRSKGKLNERDVKDVMREIRLALLEADVNYKVAKDFTNTVGEKCIGEKVMDRLKNLDEVAYVRRKRLLKLSATSLPPLWEASRCVLKPLTKFLRL